jgi:hypothetical protein
MHLTLSALLLQALVSWRPVSLLPFSTLLHILVDKLKDLGLSISLKGKTDVNR